MTQSASSITPAKKKVLIVEDEAIVAMHLSELLASRGYDVAGIAASAEAALEKYAQSKPDVVLMDITIKGKMDGVMVAEKILAEKTAPVVFLTAHADDDTLRRVQAVSPYGFILKPFKDAELCAALEIAMMRFQSEVQVYRKRDLLEDTLMSIPEGLVAVDKQACVQIMNDEAERLTGWKRSDAFYRPVDEVMKLVEERSHQRIEPPLITALREKRTVQVPPKTRLVSRNGAETPIVDSAAPIYSREGEVVGAVMVFYDLTLKGARQIEAEYVLQKLIQEQREDALRKIASGMAHNYNNILAAILGNLSLLQMEIEKSSQSNVQTRLRRIEESAMRAAMLTSQLVGYTGQGRLHIEPVNLNALAKEVLDEMSETVQSDRVVIECAFSANLPAVQGDRVQLKQVILNLFLNALEAIEEKATKQSGFRGKIQLSTFSSRLSEKEAHSFVLPDNNSFVCLAISDNGIGIATEHQSKIFEPFFSTKEMPRAGLGLSMAQGVVKSHRGVIICNSIPKEGTTFSVWLPAYLAQTV
ncbi:MAG: response regulator [Chloroherpetonaceae bacterium]|nr:response regulator [Chloroherpetonaceae bacterium]